MKERAEVCRFPGCDARYVEGHHIKHWPDGGETELDNLIQLCRRHHRLLHEGGYRAVLDDDGVATFFAANGELISAGLEINAEITAETNLPEWDGEPPDSEWITSVMTDRPTKRCESEWTVGPAP